MAELRDQGIWCVLFPKRAVFLNCVITGFRSRDAEQIVAAYRLIDAIQVCEGRTMRPKAGGPADNQAKDGRGRNVAIAAAVGEMVCVVSTPKKSDSAVTSSTSLSAQVAPPALKQEIKDFFAVEGLTESASPALKEQVVGFLKTLKDQVKKIGEIVAAIEECKKGSDKKPSAKLKRSRP